MADRATGPRSQDGSALRQYVRMAASLASVVPKAPGGFLEIIPSSVFMGERKDKRLSVFWSVQQGFAFALIRSTGLNVPWPSRAGYNTQDPVRTSEEKPFAAPPEN